MSGEFEYKISIDKKIIAILGPHLYGDTASIVAELIANSHDADAKNCWVTIKTGANPEVIIEDDGHGMTPEEVNKYFLDIGYDRRTDRPKTPDGREVFGRKGIGKLATFSLAKNIELYSLKDGRKAGCILDYNKLTKENEDPETIPDSKISFDPKKLSRNGTGTRIVMKEIQKNINTTYYYLINKIIRNFNLGHIFLFSSKANPTDFRNQISSLPPNIKTDLSAIPKTDLDRIMELAAENELHLEINGGTYDFEMTNAGTLNVCFTFKIHIAKNNEPPKVISYSELNFFNKMDTIITIGEEYREKGIAVKNNEISGEYKSIVCYDDDSEDKKKLHLQIPRTIELFTKNGEKKTANFTFNGWIGTIINKDQIKSLIKKDGASADEEKSISINDNRITIFSRKRIGEYDVLPKVQTTRVYDAYVIGEIHVNLFEDDRFVDMAISNRRGYEETDSRYQALMEDLKSLVSFITSKKASINKKRSDDNEKKVAEQIKENFKHNSKTGDILKKKLDPTEQKVVEGEHFQFTRATQLAKKTKKVMISHNSENKEYGMFILRIFELLGVNTEEIFIFTSHTPTAVPYGQDIYEYLKEAFRDDMYIIFLFSKHFYDSNMSVAETGAAWATNREYGLIVIDIDFPDVDKPINNSRSGLTIGDLDSLDRDGMKNFIKVVYSHINLLPPADAKIQEVVESAIGEFRGKLSTNSYYPLRKYQGHPVCNKLGCGNGMILKKDATGAYYECETPSCHNRMSAKI